VKVLAICETIDFQNFTRRYTTEALGRANVETTALCHTHVQNLFRTKLFSRFLKVTCYYGIIPFDIKRGILRKVEYLIKFRWQKFFKKFDIIIISSPNQNYFLDFISSEQKVVYLISDPYYLMNYSRDKELEILKRAELILATSKNLANKYVQKYYKIDRICEIFYWPNSVEIDVWRPEKQCNKTDVKKPIIGFAGNFMKLLDLLLLEKVVKTFEHCQIVLCGKITYNQNGFKASLNKILQYPNVTYKGLIPYSELPREVKQWDVCIMLDDLSELSSYHHHNKLYQYLALGKPVVAQRNHDDHNILSDIIYLSDTHEEYLWNLKRALSEQFNCELYERRITAGVENSADVRAQQLVTKLINLCSLA
jgi:hypothetical protein